MYNICNCLNLSHCQLHMLYNKQQFGNFVLSMCTCRNCQMHTLCNRTIVHSRQEYMQVQHATCNWKCAHMHESSSWDCAFCSKSVVIYKVVNVSSLLSPSLSRRQSRSLLPSVTLETNQHLRSIAAIKQIGQIFCVLFKTGRSSCFKRERNEVIQDGGLYSVHWTQTAWPSIHCLSYPLLGHTIPVA